MPSSRPIWRICAGDRNEAGRPDHGRPRLIMMVRETWPDIPVPLSVQPNTVNYAAVKILAGLGLTRVILSREISLDEIAEIRQQCPDMELEVFVHGALCIAYSGAACCPGSFNHRDANQAPAPISAAGLQGTRKRMKMRRA